LYSGYTFKQWYQIKSLNKYVVIASQASLLFTLVAKVILIVLSKNIIWYAVILVGGVLIEVCILSFFYRIKAISNGINKFDLRYSKHLFTAGLPLVFSSLAVAMYMKIDQIMIGRMLGTHAVGIYSIAVTISELVYFIPTSIMNAVYPKIAKAKKDGKDYESLIIKTASLNVGISLTFAICCTLIIPYGIRIVYGEAYIAAARVIQIHCWAGIFVAIGVSHGSYLIFNNLQTYGFVATISAALLNIILNYYFIKWFGINGAAITTVISYAFSTYLFFIFFKDKKIFLMRTKSLLLKIY
jgi:PST family polysaccharide transporter